MTLSSPHIPARGPGTPPPGQHGFAVGAPRSGGLTLKGQAGPAGISRDAGRAALSGGRAGPPPPPTTLLLLCPQMLSCLEHMYHDLGLVRDFSINPITLRRWLVSAGPHVPLEYGVIPLLGNGPAGHPPGGAGPPTDGGDVPMSVL